jgi:short subunit dehydrogenase-like uncharacterized protein
MAGRIVLFGATGYTGDLTARELVKQGAKPLLAARNEQRLEQLASELGGDLETQVADVDRPQTVRALVGEGDVMVSTVGPFVRWGDPAIEAAIEAGATYIDSTGEPPFIRRVFEHYGPAAQRAGSALITAMGYDWVPGNLAGGLALERAGEAATKVEIGYFISGSGASGMSGGTKASAAGAMLAPSFAWSAGRLVTERGGKKVRSFDVRGKDLSGITAGSSEHFGLPAAFPQLRDVDVYLGWFGPLSRPIQGFSAVMAGVQKIPGASSGLDSVVGRFVKGSTGGPDEQARAKSGSQIVAIASDAGGRQLSEVRLEGVNGYTFTARMLAWAAMQTVDGGVEGTGALGPVEAFGLERLKAGVAECGLEVVGQSGEVELQRT